MRRISKLIAILSVLSSLALFAAAQTQRPTNPQDAKIQQDVQKIIADHPSFKGVQASVDDRIVLLNGTVDVYADKLRAGDAVRHADGVDGVRNHITVNTAQISDQQLQDQLADKLRYDRVDQGIVFNSFTLNVNSGHVTIGGVARTDTDAASALAIVEHEKGVTDVTDNIKVAPTSNFDDELRVRTARAIYGNPALQKYASDPQAPIRIVVVNGHITLDGAVDSQADKIIAGTQASSVPGAYGVTNNLMVANQSASNNKSH